MYAWMEDNGRMWDGDNFNVEYEPPTVMMDDMRYGCGIDHCTETVLFGDTDGDGYGEAPSDTEGHIVGARTFLLLLPTDDLRGAVIEAAFWSRRP